jgi:acyl carrier protein
MEREEVLAIINLVLANKGRACASDDETPLREAGVRSLDFSEVALRVEDAIGRELNFEASVMRRITTVKDVIDFFVSAADVSVSSH